MHLDSLAVGPENSVRIHYVASSEYLRVWRKIKIFFEQDGCLQNCIKSFSLCRELQSIYNETNILVGWTDRVDFVTVDITNCQSLFIDLQIKSFDR